MYLQICVSCLCSDFWLRIFASRSDFPSCCPGENSWLVSVCIWYSSVMLSDTHGEWGGPVRSDLSSVVILIILTNYGSRVQVNCKRGSWDLFPVSVYRNSSVWSVEVQSENMLVMIRPSGWTFGPVVDLKHDAALITCRLKQHSVQPACLSSLLQV